MSNPQPDRAQTSDELPLDTKELFALVYRELRKLAAHKMSQEVSGQTLQPTALVHEAWLRLVREDRTTWQNRAQFFSAAGEAMRRILIEKARQKLTKKRGNKPAAEEVKEFHIVLTAPSEQVRAVHEALDELSRQKPEAAEWVKLRYFIGMTLPEAAEAMETSLRTANRLWVYARAWLQCEITKDMDDD